MQLFQSLLLLILLNGMVAVQAATHSDKQQSHAEITAAIQTFVRTQTRTLPGKVSFKIDEIDRRTVRPACASLEIFLPAGSQLLGNSMVGARCPGNKGWTLFVPVHVAVSVDMLITSKALAQGHVLVAEDISSQKGELLQTDVMIELSEAVGKILTSSLGAGQVLKQSMLRAPYAVTQGQTVQLQVEGAGFSLRSEGQALSNAVEGQSLKVKTSSGQVVSGTARQGGVVDIRP
jgi:flagella basal body P-ring formation protein FlgA